MNHVVEITIQMIMKEKNYWQLGTHEHIMQNQIYQTVYKYLKEGINSENDLFHRSEKC